MVSSEKQLKWVNEFLLLEILNLKNAKLFFCNATSYVKIKNAIQHFKCKFSNGQFRLQGKNSFSKKHEKRKWFITEANITLANTYSINLVESCLEKKFVVAHVIF